MPSRRIQIEPALLSEIERIGRKERVPVSRVVNEALSVALAERRRRGEAPIFLRLPRCAPSDRDRILSVLDF